MKFLFFLSFLFSANLFAQSHELINSTRSYSLFVSSGIELSTGRHLTLLPGETTQDAKKGDKWQTSSMRSEAGIEIIKFIKFSASHVLERSKMQNDSLASSFGSKLILGSSASFSSPAGNLYGMVGAIMSTTDYSRLYENATYYGKGITYGFGIEYFIHPRVSIKSYVRTENEKRTKVRGNSDKENVNIKNDIFGLSSSIWL